MTREEVINAARAVLEEATGSETAVCYLTSEDKGWLEMAIKALEQEPCDDCISRQAVLDIVNNPLNIRLDEIIKKLPPVTPQPKTGYWISWYEIIEEEWGTEHNPHCKCSECSTEVDPHTSKFINCCPVCGAKMVGYKKREEKE